jgi:hypothetical protein
VFYNQGPAYVQTASGTNTPNQTVVTANPAYAIAEADMRRIQSVCIGEDRLVMGVHYSESYGVETNGAAVTTVTIFAAVPVSDTIRIMYASPTAMEIDQSNHPTAAEKPIGVRGKDVDVYLGGYTPGADNSANRVSSVRSVNIDWRVTVERDEELGSQITEMSFDVPEVTGTVQIRPRSPQELATLVRRSQGVVDVTQSLGAESAVPIALDVVVRDPDTGVAIKRLHVEDARFDLPGFTGRVQSVTDWDLNFTSDTGDLLVFVDPEESS